MQLVTYSYLHQQPSKPSTLLSFFSQRIQPKTIFNVHNVPFRTLLVNTHCQCLSVSDVAIEHIDVILSYRYDLE
jgi:hypothetical protein